jgi:putative ABC transport system substrate-binding protein
VQRREFIALVGVATAAWPLAARTQHLTQPVIGFLFTETPELFTNRLRAFNNGLRETGYVEGENVAVEYRWAEGQNRRLPALASDLVRRQVTVIVANGPAAVAAKVATTTIPIIFFSGGDPVERGLVVSLSRPGKNLTGVSTLGIEMAAKQVQLLHELVPASASMTLLVNPTNPTLAPAQIRAVREAANALGLELNVLHASTESDFDIAFANAVQLRSSALVIAVDALFTTRIKTLAALALRHGIPAAFPFREFAAAGGLISYGSSDADAFRLMGVYTGKVLKGEKPSDLPVEQPTKFELVINLKSAKALGLTIPPLVLARADEVIE